MAHALVSQEFVQDIYDGLERSSALPFGTVKEEGGSLELGSDNQFHPSDRSVGGSKTVSIPRSAYVWHTHPGTCHSGVSGCSVEPPSEQDMVNVVDAAFENDQVCSIVFGLSKAYVVSVSREFKDWVRDTKIPMKTVRARIRRAFVRYHKKPEVPRGTGPFYKKAHWHKGFKIGWEKFTASLRFPGEQGRPMSPYIFKLWVYAHPRRKGIALPIPNGIA